MGIFSFSKELHKQYFKIPITIPPIIYLASSIITFITLQKPSILLLIFFIIVFVIANGMLYFLGKKDRISSDKFEIFTMQTMLIFMIYSVIAFVIVFIIIKFQEVNYYYLAFGCLIIFIFFSLQIYFKKFKSFKFFVLTNVIVLFLSIVFLNENIISYLKIGNFKAKMTLNKRMKDRLLENNISFTENEESLIVKDLYILLDAKDAYYIQSKKEENKKLKKPFPIDKKYVLDKDF